MKKQVLNSEHAIIEIYLHSTKLLISFGIFYLFGVLDHFQHCTGHIMTGSFAGRGNQYIQLVGQGSVL